MTALNNQSTLITYLIVLLCLQQLLKVLANSHLLIVFDLYCSPHKICSKTNTSAKVKLNCNEWSVSYFLSAMLDRTRSSILQQLTVIKEHDRIYGYHELKPQPFTNRPGNTHIGTRLRLLTQSLTRNLSQGKRSYSHKTSP